MRIGSGGCSGFASPLRRPKLRVPGEDGSSPRAPVTSTEGSSGSSADVERQKRWLAKSHHRGPRGASLKHRARDTGYKPATAVNTYFGVFLIFSHRAVETGKSPASHTALILILSGEHGIKNEENGVTRQCLPKPITRTPSMPPDLPLMMSRTRSPSVPVASTI